MAIGLKLLKAGTNGGQRGISATPVVRGFVLSLLPSRHSCGRRGKMSAGELYLSLRKKSGMKLPQSKISYFGRFLRKAVELIYNSKRGMLYLVVENEGIINRFDFLGRQHAYIIYSEIVNRHIGSV